MKTQSSTLKVPVLIGVLLVVALLINLFFHRQALARREAQAQEQRQAAAAAEARQKADQLEKEKLAAEAAQQQAAKAEAEKRARDEAEAKDQAEAARKKALEDAAVAHSQFLARYLNSGFTRKSGIATIAITIESEQGTINSVIADALSQHFTNTDVQFLNSFFKPEFVADKFVDDLFSGDTGIFDRLELTNTLSGVLIGRQTVDYSTNASLENTITAHMRLQVLLLPVGLTRQSQSWTFASDGIGFRSDEARQAAEDRLVKQIDKNNNMVLRPSLRNP